VIVPLIFLPPAAIAVYWYLAIEKSENQNT